MGECGLGKSTTLKYVIPAIFHTIRGKSVSVKAECCFVAK